MSADKLKPTPDMPDIITQDTPQPTTKKIDAAYDTTVLDALAIIISRALELQESSDQEPFNSQVFAEQLSQILETFEKRFRVIFGIPATIIEKFDDLIESNSRQLQTLIMQHIANTWEAFSKESRDVFLKKITPQEVKALEQNELEIELKLLTDFQKKVSLIGISLKEILARSTDIFKRIMDIITSENFEKLNMGVLDIFKATTSMLEVLETELLELENPGKYKAMLAVALQQMAITTENKNDNTAIPDNAPIGMHSGK